MRKGGNINDPQSAHERLRAMLDPQEPAIVRILAAIRTRRQGAVSYAAVSQGLLDGDMGAEWLESWRQEYSQFVNETIRPRWQLMAEQSGGAMSEDIADFIAQPFSANLTGSRIVDWAESRAGVLIRDWTEDQQAAARFLIGRALDEGTDASELAVRLRAVIGLREDQVRAVEKYRRGVIETGVSENRAGVLAKRYAAELHRRRALTIARTELAYAYNRGEHEAVLQADGQDLFGGTVIGVWSTADDERVCPTCEGLDGAAPRLGGIFEGVQAVEGDPLSGQTPPAHVVCRCVIIYRVIPR